MRRASGETPRMKRPVTSCCAVVLIAACSALLLGRLLAPAGARAEDEVDREIARYRGMLQADPWANPALLDADRGEALWKERRGPKSASLEACDLGKGPGVVAGAFAELPRYFADADRVMDLESRLVWCMQRLQGFDRSEILRQPYSEANQSGTELEALTTYVAVNARGHSFAAPTGHPKERAAIMVGEALFFRRQGPMDFACASCHGATGMRIRLQSLPYLSEPAEARQVIGEWPAYRVSQGTVMTMQHRIADCFWQMRLPRIDYGSEATIALTSYLVDRARGGAITAPAIKR
jgi:sulfur-oxidizing protein SoxA